MEAVPRLPMVPFEIKSSPENVDFASKIRQLIVTNFGEDPASFSKEIKELETLRANSCIRVAESIDGVATLKKYFCQLSFLKSRFKVGSEGPFQFTWRDIYSSTDYTVSDINYELASVMYNIGALHSRLGCSEQRQDSDGMKMAVAHFQCAAWAFHRLPDQFPQDSDTDLCSELLALQSQVCLAQAQECILEKSILDSRKPVIIAKVCSQVVEYYRQALRQLETSSKDDHGDNIGEIVGSKQIRQWRNVLDFKVAYYGALGFLHCGMVSEESQRMGERVAFLQAASESLGTAAKLSSKLDDIYRDVGDAIQYSSDVINGKLDNAKKENEFIYHEKVPEKDSLQPVKGASLVKGIGWESTDPEVSGPDLFARLVPLEAHLGGSLYTEEQAKLLRTVGGEIEDANNTIVVYLSSLQLEDIPPPIDDELPLELIECAAGLSVRPEAVQQLQEAMAKLASVSSDVESSLSEIQAMLKEEEEKELEFQAIVGKRPKSIISELERETRKYHEAHSMASESNLTLHKAMQLHVKNLKLLSTPMGEIQAGIPSLSCMDESTKDSLKDMRSIMAKVDEMRSQRAQLEGELRAALHSDDITESLARRGNKDQEKVFQEEIKKHDKTVSYIRQNIHAQQNIIRAVTEKNAEYADARLKVDDLVRQREDVIGSLVASYHAYEDLLNKTTKGLEFYDRLDANVTKLLARIGGVVKVQEEERVAQLASTTKKTEEARALSLRLVSGGGQQPEIPYSHQSQFIPGAPPPDTPDGVPGDIYPPTTAKSRPKLSDYLNARKGSLTLNKGPSGGQVSEVTDVEVPNIRPQPLGEEGPKIQHLHQQPWQGSVHSTNNNILSVAQPISSTIIGNQHQSTPHYGALPPSGMQYHYTQAGQYPLNPLQSATAASHALIQHQQQVPHRQHQMSGQQLGQSYNQNNFYMGPQAIPQQRPLSEPACTTQPPQNYPPTHPINDAQMKMKLQQATLPQQHLRPGQQMAQIDSLRQLNTQVAQSGQSNQTLHHIGQPFQQNIVDTGYTKQQVPRSEHPNQSILQTGPLGHMYQYPPNNQRQMPQITQSKTQPGTSNQQTNHPGQPYQQMVVQPGIPNPQVAPIGHPIPQLAKNEDPSKAPHAYSHQVAYTGQPNQGPAVYTGQVQQVPQIQQHQIPPTQQKQDGTPSPVISQSAQAHNQVCHGQQIFPQQMAPLPQQQGVPLAQSTVSQVGQQAYSPQMTQHNTPHQPGQSGYPQINQSTSTGHAQHQPVMTQSQQHIRFQQQPLNIRQPMPINTPVPYQHPIQPTQQPAKQPYVGQQQTVPSTGQQPSAHVSGLNLNQQLQQQRFNQQQNVIQPKHGQDPVQQNRQSQIPQQGIQSAPQVGHYGTPGQMQPGHPQVAGHQYIRPPYSMPQTSQQITLVPSSTAPHQTTLSVPTPGSNLALLSSLSLTAPSVSTGGTSPPPSIPVVPMPGTNVSQSNIQPKPVPAPPSVPDEERIGRLSQETEKLQNLMTNISSKTLGGLSPLEDKWKEVHELVEHAKVKRSVSVARCYPSINRVPDVLPFDQTRVSLANCKDDYINASVLDSPLGRGPGAIITQAPLLKSFLDFWRMIWQEGVEVLVCLVPDQYLDAVYLPEEKERSEMGEFTIVTYSCKKHSNYMERVVNITNSHTKTTRALMHLQMFGWPGPDLPHSPACLLDTAVAVTALKSRSRVVVHCVDGSSKSGTFLAILWLVAEMETEFGPGVPCSSSTWPPVIAVFTHIMLQRKGVVRDKQFLKLVYEAILYYCQNVLMKQGILNTGCNTQPTVKTHSRHPSLDFVFSNPLENTLALESTSLAPQVASTDPPDVNILNTVLDEESNEDIIPEIAESKEHIFKNIPDDLTKLADISLTESPKKKKISREDFLNPSNRIGTKSNDPEDPLDQLDPLWTLK